jgi:hypothetical protein
MCLTFVMDVYMSILCVCARVVCVWVCVCVCVCVLCVCAGHHKWESCSAFCITLSGPWKEAWTGRGPSSFTDRCTLLKNFIHWDCVVTDSYKSSLFAFFFFFFHYTANINIVMILSYLKVSLVWWRRICWSYWLVWDGWGIAHGLLNTGRHACIF